MPNAQYEIMNNYFQRLCKSSDLEKKLQDFACGIGFSDGGTICVFADDPDENDPHQLREFPELVGFEGVGFFSDYYPEPLLINYQEFYDNLKAYVGEYVSKQSSNYKEVLKYLEKIRLRYSLK